MYPAALPLPPSMPDSTVSVIAICVTEGLVRAGNRKSSALVSEFYPDMRIWVYV